MMLQQSICSVEGQKRWAQRCRSRARYQKSKSVVARTFEADRKQKCCVGPFRSCRYQRAQKKELKVDGREFAFWVATLGGRATQKGGLERAARRL